MKKILSVILSIIWVVTMMTKSDPANYHCVELLFFCVIVFILIWEVEPTHDALLITSIMAVPAVITNFYNGFPMDACFYTGLTLVSAAVALIQLLGKRMKKLA